MSNHPDEEYFVWLYAQVGIAKLKNPARTHWSLCRQLYKKEFVWLVPNDDNRVADGKDLREEFVREFDLEPSIHPTWSGMGCSMLEMLIALSRHLSFLTDVDPREWFWEVLENMGIGIAHTSDKLYNEKIEKEVDEILDIVIWRTYAPDGSGGMFPIVDPKEDQRDVEIWYQLSAYLLPDI